MKKIILQVHDIKDPLNYSINFLKKMQEVSGEIDVLIVLPNLSQHVIDTIEIPFKHKIMIGDEYIQQHISINSFNNIDLESCILQQKVYEKIGLVMPLNNIIKRQIAYVSLYKKIIDNFDPDLCICWNGQVHIDQTAFRDTSKNLMISTIFLERGLIPNSIFYDKEGVNATSSVTNWSIEDYSYTDYKHDYGLIKSYINKEGLAVVKLDQKKDRFNAPYIFFPLQRDSDSNLVTNSKYFKNMYSILKEINNTVLPIDIHYRVHPEDPQSHYTKHLIFENQMLHERSNVDLEQHLNSSAAVMTINSTIGFSALLKDKLVITLGESLYANKGFTIDYKDYLSFEKIFSQADSFKLNSELIERKNRFVSKVIMNRHVVFENSHLSFLQINNLKNYIDNNPGEPK